MEMATWMRDTFSDPGGKVSLEEVYLKMWASELTPDERSALQEGKRSGSSGPFEKMIWLMPRKVRFEVSERFANAEGSGFTLFTGSGGGDCGVQFEPGESYLVVAYQEPVTKRWTATICSRTRRVSGAEEDLKTLRHWKAGGAIEPSVFGSVLDWTWTWTWTRTGDSLYTARGDWRTA